jgi:hypothetical protein
MILADSSALIEYYRPSGLPAAQAKVAAAIAADEIAVNGIIQVEILAFAPDRSALRKLRNDFLAFHVLPLRSEDFDRATELGFDLRRKSLTVPATDLIIAASALRAGATLYHLDSHFDRMAELCELKAERLGP